MLVERDHLLARLDDLRRTAVAGKGSIVFVAGEAGAGKTALINAFLTRLGPRVIVLAGACDALATPRALGPVLDIAHEVGGGLADAADSADRHHLMTALLDELRHPSLLVIEDAHWADQATLDVIRFVGRRAAQTRSVVVVSYRNDEAPPGTPLRSVLGDLATYDHAVRLEVPPLSPDGVALLAVDHGMDPVRLSELTGGNPFYVTEVLAAAGWTLPATVGDAVLARAGRLSESSRRALEAASIVPGEVATEMLSALTDLDEMALTECRNAGMLVLTLNGVGFRHELARLAVESSVDAHRRAEFHRRAIDVLESSDSPDAARVAHHAEAAGDRDRLLRFAVIGGREAAARGAHREALRLYALAARLVDLLAPLEAADLLEAQASEMAAADRGADAYTVRLRALELRRSSGNKIAEGATLTRLAGDAFASGQGADAHRLAAEAVTLLEQVPPSAELAAAYAVSATMCMLRRDRAGAMDWGAKAVATAEDFGNEAAKARALNALGSIRIASLEDPEGITDLKESARIASAIGDDLGVGRALINLGSACGEVKWYQDAERYLAESVAFTSERDLDSHTHYAVAWQGRVNLEQGRWDLASRLARSVAALPDLAPSTSIVAHRTLGRLAARRGEDAASEHLDHAWRLAVPTGDLQRIWPVAATRAEHAWLRGLAPNTDELQSTFTLAEKFDSRWAIGEVGFWLWRAGELRGLDGETPYAIHTGGDWRGAAEAWRALGCPYEEADALSEGDEDAMRRALGIFTDLGAAPAADLVRRRLRASGARSIPSRPRASTSAGPAGLTKRQIEILGLVEEGATNAEIARRLFISEKTAGHHVSAILAKLGVRTRGEAAAAARRLVDPQK
jgi:DNA-binding CsgD family transcriptional regulator/tetratricopeptide (TPR) repeat protein